MDGSRSRMLARFAGLSAVVFLLVGLGLHVVSVRFVTAHFGAAAEFHAQFVAQTLVRPHLLASDGPAPVGALTDVLAGDALAGDMLAVRVWGADGRLLAADRDLGVVDPPTEAIASALDAGARGWAAPVGPTSPVDLDRHPEVTQVLATYVPLDGELPVVVELVQDWGDSAEAAAEFSRTLDAGLGAGLALLWGLLLPVVSRIATRMRDQNSQLEAQGAELGRLLAVEQHTSSRLQELHELKDGFITAVSHELRTPLTVVLGSLRTLQSHDDDLEAGMRRRLHERAVASGERLENLLTALLDLNPGTQDWRPTNPEPIALDALIGEVLDHVPDVEVDVDLEVLTVQADRVQLDCIVANLVGNAARHTPPGTQIRIWSRQATGGVLFGVDDDGGGVPDALKQDIFEPFTQGHLHDAHSPGTGIGLSLVRRFAKLHGGDAWVEDRTGGGSSFRVVLPQPRGGPAGPSPVGSAHDDRIDAGAVA